MQQDRQVHNTATKQYLSFSSDKCTNAANSTQQINTVYGSCRHQRSSVLLTTLILRQQWVTCNEKLHKSKSVVFAEYRIGGGQYSQPPCPGPGGAGRQTHLCPFEVKKITFHGIKHIQNFIHRNKYEMYYGPGRHALVYCTICVC